MSRLTPKIVIKAYLIVILLFGVLVSPLPQFAFALVLLALQLYTTYNPLKPSLNLALIAGTLIFEPLLLVPLAGSLLSGLFIIPAVYLLDQSLRENASIQFYRYHKAGRKATSVLTTLLAVLFTVLVMSLLLLNEALVLSTSVLMIYTAAVLTYNLKKISKQPLKETKTWNRVLVGNTESSVMRLSTTTDLPLLISLSASEPWINLKKPNFTLKAAEQTEINLSYTPPLAGPSKLQIQASAVDPWGLIQVNQTLEPVDLHIIPKAKYVWWLAKKYLEQTAAGTAYTATIPPPRAFNAAKRGVEFYGSRLYQPGDRLKDVDWKHTFMLDELIIKEFAGAHGQPTIIVADLTAKDAQDADKLAYNVVMAALTSAIESLPSGLAVYSQQEVIASTAPMNPRENLKKAMKVTEKIRIVEQPPKVMQPTEINRLKRTIIGLNHIEREAQKNLAEMLEFEYEAIKMAAKVHPSTQAVMKCISKTPAPATITVASSMSYDADALQLTLEKLKEKGYNTVMVSQRL